MRSVIREGTFRLQVILRQVFAGALEFPSKQTRRGARGEEIKNGATGESIISTPSKSASPTDVNINSSSHMALLNEE